MLKINRGIDNHLPQDDGLLGGFIRFCRGGRSGKEHHTFLKLFLFGSWRCGMLRGSFLVKNIIKKKNKFIFS